MVADRLKIKAGSRELRWDKVKNAAAQQNQDSEWQVDLKKKKKKKEIVA